MLTMSVIALPVAPAAWPDRTASAKAPIASSTAMTSALTSCPSTVTPSPVRSRSAVCNSTARFSVTLIFLAANIAARRPSRSAASAASPAAHGDRVDGAFGTSRAAGRRCGRRMSRTARDQRRKPDACWQAPRRDDRARRRAVSGRLADPLAGDSWGFRHTISDRMFPARGRRTTTIKPNSVRSIRGDDASHHDAMKECFASARAAPDLRGRITGINPSDQKN